jgi:putative ABC transport system substrate-binding protein
LNGYDLRLLALRVDMKRRKFIGLIGSAAAWPIVARAQQPGKLPIIGFLGASTSSAWRPWVSAFESRLRELGWTDGRTIAIEYRWAKGRSETYAEIAREFARQKVDVIVTVGGAVPSTKQVTSVIPIVFAVASDPVGGGLVASLARPGGNVTGLSVQSDELVGKQVELLREVVPKMGHLAILTNVGYVAAILQRDKVQAAARALSLETTTLDTRRAEDIATAFKALNGRADALFVCNEPLANANQVHINSLALAARLPTMSGVKDFAETGGLLSYGPEFLALWRRAAEYVDKILRGMKPANMPVEQPTKFEFVINVKTANALGLTIPPSMLLRADTVIE